MHPTADPLLLRNIRGKPEQKCVPDAGLGPTWGQFDPAGPEAMPGADRREWATDQDVGQSWGKRVEWLNGVKGV